MGGKDTCHRDRAKKPYCRSLATSTKRGTWTRISERTPCPSHPLTQSLSRHACGERVAVHVTIRPMLCLRIRAHSYLVLFLMIPAVFWGQQAKESVALSDGSINFQVLDSATGYAVSSATIRRGVAGQSAVSALSHSGF